MAEILIRNVPDELLSALESEAALQHRSREKQALHLLEEGLHPRAAETCGDMLARIDQGPPPRVDDALLDAFAAQRGRRSSRP